LHLYLLLNIVAKYNMRYVYFKAAANRYG